MASQLVLYVTASTDDATIDDIYGGYNDAGVYIYWGVPGTSPTLTDSGHGARFLNVTLSSTDTVSGAYLNLTKDTNEWQVVLWRLTAIAQDNTATFSSGSAPGSRPIDTNIAAENLNVNHTDPTVYKHPSTAGLQTTLGSAVQAVLNRAGWSSGNALAIVDQSKQDAGQQSGSSREAYYTYDNGSKVPSLVIDYTADSGGGATVTLGTLQLMGLGK